MAQLEQAIMSSELSLEDLDHLLAVSSSADTVLVPASVSATVSALTHGQTVGKAASFFTAET